MKPAIEKLFAIPLFSDLLQKKVVTIWLEKREGESRVKVRTEPKGPVQVVEVKAFEPLVSAVAQVLAGRNTLDVTVNGVDIMITRVEPVGGVEYAITTPSANQIHKFHREVSFTI